MNGHPLRVGDIRPSQFMWTFGPGAIVDLPQVSVVVLGPEFWRQEHSRRISEPRLLNAVRSQLGPQVQELLAPPVRPDTDGPFNPFTSEASIGAPVSIFPQYLRCPICGTLGKVDSGLFELKPNEYRPDRIHYIHSNCSTRGKSPTAVPARFLVACRDGHLDDFPWHWFVHGGASQCRGQLRFFERGASLQTDNLWVQCMEPGCTATRTMTQAFGDMGRQLLPGCRGRHPHLRGFDRENCTEPIRTVLLGASNSWFPVTASVLAIPTRADKLQQLLEANWDIFKDVTSLRELDLILKTMRKTGNLGDLAEFNEKDILAAIKKMGTEAASPEVSTEPLDLKQPEWDIFTDPAPQSDWPDFMVKKEGPPDAFSKHIESVLLVEKLREVNALLGFTRIEPLEVGQTEDGVARAPLWRGSAPWVPATEVRGEGVFIKFSSQQLSKWLAQKVIEQRRAALLAGHIAWRTARRLQPPADHFPGMLMILLHTFSHVLLRELALECGYNTASIRERIYASPDGGATDVAGVLLYTAAADSDGTLGGLVELGKKENLDRLIKQALRRAQICSSDPLCAEHTPERDRSLHGSACHACSFAPETSCEFSNRYLDRSLLVPTIQGRDLAFFEEKLYADL